MTIFTSTFGHRTSVMCASSLLIFVSITMLLFLDDYVSSSMIVVAMCFFGVGRGMLASVIANSLGMVTKDENRTLLFSLYTFSCNLGNVIYITIFAKITDDQNSESYETGLAIFCGISF